MLQFISHRNDKIDEFTGIKAALDGGCRWIQLRMKQASDAELIAIGRKVAELCHDFEATFIIDDHVELVEEINADGVHLGKNDMPVNEARAILGKSKIIGATANTFDDIHKAYNLGADYIGLGPFRFTTTKVKLSPILGIEGYKSIMSECRKHNINLPVVAIGGITCDDIPALMRTGITGIALSGTIINADDPTEQTRIIINELNK